MTNEARETLLKYGATLQAFYAMCMGGSNEALHTMDDAALKKELLRISDELESQHLATDDILEIIKNVRSVLNNAAKNEIQETGYFRESFSDTHLPETEEQPTVFPTLATPVMVTKPDKLRIHLVVGPTNVGKTASIVTKAAIDSEGYNVAIVDLTVASKVGMYGLVVRPMDELSLVSSERLVAVTGTYKQLTEELPKIEANATIPMYVLVDVHDTAVIKNLIQIADSVIWATDCNPVNMQVMEEAIAKNSKDVLISRVMMIGAPVPPNEFIPAMNIDIYKVRLINIPYCEGMRKSVFYKKLPSEDSECRGIIERAFV